MIIYFSATGNCKYCAEFLASSIGDKIISMNEMIKNNINVLDCSGQERIGIAAPTYDLDLAYVVSEFLERLEFQNVPANCYVYGVITCGSSCGNSGETLRAILAKKNLKLNSAFKVVMPDNYVPLFKQKSESSKHSMLERADKTLKEIAKDIIEKRNVFKLKGKIPGFVMFLIHKFFIPSQRRVKGFTVNDDCIYCGLCVKVCPMNIIELKNSRPVWTNDNCACCLACLHRCPKRAINRGNSAKNGRYINPNAKL